ncbi:MAG: MFS transporter [Rhabdochlamydiaceae bacterium]
MKRHHFYLTLFLLYFVFFLDIMGFAIVYTTVDVISESHFGKSTPDFLIRHPMIMGGLTLAAYPLAQLIGAPFIGRLSDTYGRKTTLIGSLIFTALSFLTSGLSLILQNIWLFIFSRFISGFSSGNITIAQASISDMSSEAQRGKFMSLFNIAWGLAWLLTPFFTNFLIHNFTSLGTPFFFLAILFALSSILIFIYSYQEDALKDQNKQSSSDSVKDQIDKESSLKKLFFLLFIWYFAWINLRSFIPFYLDEQFALNSFEVGNTLSLFAVSMLFGGVIGGTSLLKEKKIIRLTLNSLLISSLASLSFSFLNSLAEFCLAGIILFFCQSLVFSSFLTLSSLLAPKQSKGKLMGFFNSVQAFAAFIAALISTSLGVINLKYPFILSFIFLVFTYLLYKKIAFFPEQQTS